MQNTCCEEKAAVCSRFERPPLVVQQLHGRMLTEVELGYFGKFADKQTVRQCSDSMQMVADDKPTPESERRLRWLLDVLTASLIICEMQSESSSAES